MRSLTFSKEGRSKHSLGTVVQKPSLREKNKYLLLRKKALLSEKRRDLQEGENAGTFSEEVEGGPYP